MARERPVVFMFSGQGSQYYQMGRELWDTNAHFQRTMMEGDRIAFEYLGRSIIGQLYSEPISREFSEFPGSHAALVIVQYALLQTLLEEGIAPDVVWGSSIGELVAAVAAGVLEFSSALRFAIEQALLVKRHCARGGMLAVFASPRIYQESKVLQNVVTLGGINYPEHFVLSGREREVEQAEVILRNQRIDGRRLPVPYGFHSAAIAAAEDPIRELCVRLPAAREATVPILSSVLAKEMRTLNGEYFWDVARRPIRFFETLLNFAQRSRGIFIDCGPSGTLATFLRRSGTDARAYATLTPFTSRVFRQTLVDLKQATRDL